MSKNIEVEVRSFITDEQYGSIRQRLDRDGVFVRELDEVTVYFTGERDLRMRRNATEAFVILKEGQLHDAWRKEFEIPIQREDFDDMVELLRGLGFEIEIEWHRRRREYEKDGMKLLLDDTAGYGKIIELEALAEETGAAAAHARLEGELAELGVAELTSKEEFGRRFEYYKENWKTLIR